MDIGGRSMTDSTDAYQSPAARTTGTASHAASGSSTWLYAFLVGMAFFAGLFLLFMYSANKVIAQSEINWRTQRQMQQVIAALREYHEDHGSFPPAVVRDSQGKPLYSWRVLLLPYVVALDDDVPHQFDLSQPWDSEHNLSVSNAWHPVFSCPIFRKPECYIYALVGEETMFPPKGCRRLSEVSDDPETTIALVSVMSRKQSWAAPRDVEIDGNGQLIGGEISPRRDQLHAASAVATLGNETFVVSRKISDKDLRAAASIAGGETVDLQTKK